MRKIILWFSLIVFFLAVFINSLIWVKSDKWIKENINELPKIKYGMILGTSKFTSSGKKNKFYTYRIEKIAELYKNQKVQKIIISGTKDEGYDEVKWIQEDLLKLGIPKKDLILDKSGDRTAKSIENFLERYKDEKNLILVSQTYHLERAIFIGQIKNPKINFYGYPADYSDTIYEPKTYLREFLSRIKLIFVDWLFN